MLLIATAVQFIDSKNEILNEKYFTFMTNIQSTHFQTEKMKKKKQIA